MKKIKTTIKGTYPLLMNKYNIERQIEQSKGRSITKSYTTKEAIEEAADDSAYWGSGKKKELIIPARCIYASILNAASFHKINRRSAKSILAGSIRIEPEEISLGTDKFDIDLRAVVVQGKNRIPKARAKLIQWEVSFEIVYNDRLIPDPILIKTILEEAGERIGLLDYRPQKAGPYGTFDVIKFEPEK